MPESLTLDAVCEGLDIPDWVKSFRDAPGTSVVFGPDAIDTLGSHARSLGSRALIVTDPGIFAAGYADRAAASLEKAGLSAFIYQSVHENPTTKDVDACVAEAQRHQIDLIIGLGGGSSMDAAKGCNFILTNGGQMKDYWGREKASRPMLPFIAIPTTAGTGSECQSFALIADAETHHKMACGDRKAAARIAILDPKLTLSQPPGVTAHTAIDALTHAIESYVCNTGTETSRAYSEAAFALIARGLLGIETDPNDLTARSELQIGAALAGTAIENSMLGAAHSLANPLTAHFNVIHGQAVGAMLPAVIRHNAKHSEFARSSYLRLRREGDLDYWIEEQLKAFGMETSLAPLGVDSLKLPAMADEAAQQWTAQFNPVKLSSADFLSLYQEVFDSSR